MMCYRCNKAGLPRAPSQRTQLFDEEDFGMRRASCALVAVFADHKCVKIRATVKSSAELESPKLASCWLLTQEAASSAWAGMQALSDLEQRNLKQTHTHTAPGQQENPGTGCTRVVGTQNVGEEDQACMCVCESEKQRDGGPGEDERKEEELRRERERRAGEGLLPLTE